MRIAHVRRKRVNVMENATYAENIMPSLNVIDLLLVKKLNRCSDQKETFLALGILPRIWPSNDSRYSRKVEEDFFSLGMERLNCTIEEPFSLKEGDSIDVTVVRVSGELSISIGEKDREPIYEGKNPELSSFRVSIPEDGDYLLSVSGKQAEGSISFQIARTSN